MVYYYFITVTKRYRIVEYNIQLLAVWLQICKIIFKKNYKVLSSGTIILSLVLNFGIQIRKTARHEGSIINRLYTTFESVNHGHKEQL